MKFREIKTWKDTLKEYDLNPYSASCTDILIHCVQEIRELRLYIKELEEKIDNLFLTENGND